MNILHNISTDDKSYFYDSHSEIVKDDTGNLYFTLYNSDRVFKLREHNNYSKLETLDIPDTTPVIEGLWKDQNNNLIGVWKDVNGFTTVSYLIKMGSENTISKLSIPERTLADITGYDFNDFIIVSGYYGAKVLQRNNSMFNKYVSSSTLQNNYLEEGISIRGITANETHVYAVREIENIYKLDKNTGQIEKNS